MVLSTRFRLARNLAGLPFPRRANRGSAEEVKQRVRRAILHEFPHWRVDNAEELTPLLRELFFEMHLISSQVKDHPTGSLVCLSPEARVALLVNEEDHLRIQLLLPGFQMGDSIDELAGIERRLERWLDFAFHPQYGYLTSCVTNVGTGLRASVMLHVPALAFAGALQSTLNLWPEPYIEFRGIFGEGSSMDTSFIQMSNKNTLGADLDTINSKVRESAQRLVALELRSRDEIVKRHRLKLEDAVHRAHGLLSAARLMSSAEATEHLSMVRLGACLGLLPNFPASRVLPLLVSIRPAHLQVESEQVLSPQDRDLRRAARLRKQIKTFVEEERDG